MTMGDETEILTEFAENIEYAYNSEEIRKTWYPMYYRGVLRERNKYAWLQNNHNIFLKGTPNKTLYNRWYFSESGFITALEYSPNGAHVIVGHSSGMIQMRHGSTGTVLCTLRNIQFPPKPVYSIEYSTCEERVCYASCMDGAVYRIEIPNIDAPLDDPPAYCIKADPVLETLNMQFYGSPGISSYSTPFITQRSPALSLGLSYDQTKMIVGYGDASIKVYDMETQEACLTYKVHKLRLQFIPKKLQRMHSGQVCALRCHKQRPYMFASGAWDNTLRIWDTRCQVGCVMTFEGVNICSDSIDLNRDHCIAGSWKPTEGLTMWDLVARKKLNVIRVQNRRPDVDGEYIYACRYWRSDDYNRKGKYGIIGGSGTNCVEVINLHNRYISCSYPAPGTVLAITSHQHRIAFGGTAPTFTIVSFFDPKHEKEKYEKEVEPEFDYTKPEVTLYEDEYSGLVYSTEQVGEIEASTKTSK
ncbi:uncharacterized protein LOC115455923 isoform X2 [Manduca sexta]|uniref:Uncharacterized protein n=1 Tax=Manduca sexta TaxID=7130 RepID=A0A921YJM0_MANSE|nr:uncharacterized protein LOC115455923 isoform X2 [Manduca sexta]KAG6440399.1 hypothetical protein O3G_MSEX001333 [Manduca sexta]